MDPLSAYRTSMALPGMNPLAGGRVSPEDTIAKIIPKGELDKLSSSVLTPGATPPPSLAGVGGVGASEGTFGFGDMVREVSAKQTAASEAMKDVMTGGSMPLHQAMIVTQEANISFQLMVEVRNKLLESYQELMRMQV